MNPSVDNEPRWYLIAIGSPVCPKMGLPKLARVENDIRRVVDIFTGEQQGYKRILSDRIRLGATAQKIKNEMSAWFADPGRKASDCVVLYIAGHGDQLGDNHYLLTSDSTERELYRKAIKTSSLVELLLEGEGERPQHILLILDTCYAGQGADQAAAAVSQARSAVRKGGSGFWIIASADSRTEASDGAFVDALLAVMQDDAWMPQGGKQYLSPLDLRDAINDWFAEQKLHQRAEATVVGSREQAIFIRNPRYTRELDGLELSDQAHWEPKARGVDAPGAPGWFFTGRRAALRELCSWLQQPQSDLLARVVTGAPGSGKSAILGWLVLTAQETSRQAAYQARFLTDDMLIPPVGAIAARFNARGARLPSMTATLAAMLGCTARDPVGFIQELAERQGPIGIVVDSLDEAAEAPSIERELLSGLASCAAVRLIVGSRLRNGHPPLGDQAVVVDLDAPCYFSRADLVEYVFARLTRRDPPSVYVAPMQHPHARRLAELVADRAGHSFLYARLISRTLALAKTAVDTTVPGWEKEVQIPAGLHEAFDTDLERFGKDKQRLIDLLIPLAYARGRGLPQKHIWYTAASHITGHAYANRDLRELKACASYYLVQDTEAGEVVYRLFHQTFADYLKDLTRDEEVERAFAVALLSLLPIAANGVEPWSQVSEPYLLHHFPSHAAAAGILEEQIRNPGFLLHVSPEALLPELPLVISPASRRIVHAYRRASYWLRTGGEATTKYAYLLWGALQFGALQLARALETLCPRLPWQPLWACWHTTVSSHILTRTPETITALTTHSNEQGKPVAICGYNHGAIQIWDLITGEMQMEYRPEGLRPKFSFISTSTNVQHLAAAVCNGRCIVIAAWNEGSLRVLDQVDGTVLGTYSCEDSLSAMCVVSLEQEVVLMAADTDLALRIWRLPQLELLRERYNATAASIYSMVAMHFDGKPAVLSGGDSVSNGENVEQHMLRIWCPEDLSVLWEFAPSMYGSMSSVRAFRAGGKDWIFGRGISGYNVIIDIAAGKKIQMGQGPGSRSSFSDLIAVWEQEDRTLIIGAYYSHLRVLEIQSTHGNGVKTATVTRVPVNAEVHGSHWSDVIELLGRPVVVSADGQQLRIWDLRELLEVSTPVTGRSTSESFDLSDAIITQVTGNERLVAAGDDWGRVWVWEQHGQLCWTKKIGSAAIRGLAFSERESKPILVVASGDGNLFVIDVANGKLFGPPIKAGEDIRALTVRSIAADPLVFVSVNLGEEHYVVRVWNLRSGEEVETRLTGRDSLGTYSLLRDAPEGSEPWALQQWGSYKRRTLYCVTALPRPHDTWVLIAGPGGEVLVFDLQSLRKINEWRVTHGTSTYVTSLAVTEDRNNVLTFAGADSGELFLHDSSSSQQIDRIIPAHRSDVADLCIGASQTGTCVISGGSDGFVRFWTLRLESLGEIEVETPIRSLSMAGNDLLFVGTTRGVMMLRLDWELLLSSADRTGPRVAT